MFKQLRFPQFPQYCVMGMLICINLFSMNRISLGATRILRLAGTVEQSLFGATIETGATLQFEVEFEDDRLLNPDKNSQQESGIYNLERFAWQGFGQSSGGNSSGIHVSNGEFHFIEFFTGFNQLPPMKQVFNSGRLTLDDKSGTLIEDDIIPSRFKESEWTDGHFFLRWGGADGPTITGTLRVVPEPNVGLTVLPTAVYLLRSKSCGRRKEEFKNGRGNKS